MKGTVGMLGKVILFIVKVIAATLIVVFVFAGTFYYWSSI